MIVILIWQDIISVIFAGVTGDVHSTTVDFENYYFSAFTIDPT
jgi:hypothetical protein